MSTEDSTEKKPWPKLRFLGFAALMLAFAILDYLVMGSIDYVGESPILEAIHTVLSLLLLLFVVAALIFVIGYGNPRFGQALASRLQYLGDAWSVPMRHLALFGAHPDTGREEKLLATRRKLHRHHRRQLARQHRERRPD